jgi:glycosyltransferase involved in cell wall biosynthesis
MTIKNCIAIVVVSMNRSEHLLETLRANCGLTGIDSITILDYGSAEALDLGSINFKCCSIYLRVEHNNTWSLSRAFNIAIALTDSDYILKTDADIVLTQELVEFVRSQASASTFLTGNPFRGGGPMFATKEGIEIAGYYNEDLIGWGFEEIDLYSRLRKRGFTQMLIPRSYFTVIEHEDSLRTINGINANRELTNLANCALGTFETGTTSTQDIISSIKSLGKKNHAFYFEDLWSCLWATLTSQKLTSILSRELSGHKTPLVLPYVYSRIRNEAEIYAELERDTGSILWPRA